MDIKSFKRFLSEAISLQDAQTIYNNFKTKLESKYKEMKPEVTFNVTSSIHLFDRTIERFNNKSELDNIFDKIYNRFFKPQFNKGFATQIDPGAFRLSHKNEWEIQHKIFVGGKNFRCIVYTVKPIIEANKVTGISNIHFVTINDMNKDGKNNVDYRYTTAITESIDWDTINEIED